jgi:hypothetical protein
MMTCSMCGILHQHSSTKWSIFTNHFYLEYIVLPKVDNMNIENLLEIDKIEFMLLFVFVVPVKEKLM